MLKGIPKILSPELLKVLCEMGHSDRIVIADGNFPSESMGKDAIVIRCDGHGVPEILDAILQVFPLISQSSKDDFFFLHHFLQTYFLSSFLFFNFIIRIFHGGVNVFPRSARQCLFVTFLFILLIFVTFCQ